jgi:hypothetical protein
LQLLHAGVISSSTYGGGNGGNVTVKVSGAALLSGADALGDDSGIYATSESYGAGGDAGTIALAAGRLQVLGGAEITATTFGRGNANDVGVTVFGPAVVAGADATGDPSGLYAEAFGDTATGNAGSLTVNARSLRVLDGGVLTSSAPLSHAQDVSVSSRYTLLAGATVDASSGGDGANVVLDSTGQLLVQQSKVTAQAGGNGGQITLTAPTVAVGGSLINGLSKKRPVQVSFGNGLVLIADTTILTDRPQFFPIFDLSGVVAPLRPPAGVLQPILDICGLKLGSSADLSSFIVIGKGGTPPEGGGWAPDIADPIGPTDGLDWSLALRPARDRRDRK